MNKLLIALLAGGVIFGGVFALAAGLTVSSQSLASGTDTVAACDEAVDVTYDVDFVTASEFTGYAVTAVNVENIDSEACSGEQLDLTLMYGGSPTSFSTTVSGTTASFDTTLDPELITAVFVLIGGNEIPTE